MSDFPTETTPTASSPATPPSSPAGAAYDTWREANLKPYPSLIEIDEQLRTVTGSPYTDAVVVTGTPGFIKDWPAGTYAGDSDKTNVVRLPFVEQLEEFEVPPLLEFEDHVFDTMFANAQVLVTKHADYGPHNIGRSPGGPLNGLRVRMHDKLARINHLLDSGADPEHESLRDSFLDLANYAVIAQLVIDGRWPE